MLQGYFGKKKKKKLNFTRLLVHLFVEQLTSCHSAIHFCQLTELFINLFNSDWLTDLLLLTKHVPSDYAKITIVYYYLH